MLARSWSWIFVLQSLLAACTRAPAVEPGPADAPPFKVELIAAGLNSPWSAAFLPDGDMLVTEKFGGLRFIHSGRLAPAPIPGSPDHILQSGDSGLLDIALDPDFAANQRIYLSFNEGTQGTNHTAVYRARLKGRHLVDGKVIFRSAPDKQKDEHSGGRMVFLPDRTLLLTVSDGFEFKDQAQNLRSDLGKVVRIDREGRPAADNPFVRTPGARPEIYTYGHRNALGLLRDPRTGNVWLHENGPKGGDEVNLLRPGANYGWPVTTYGVDYSGELISKLQTAPGIEKPLVIWSPSIAPSGFALYLGNKFPMWKGDFLVGALADQSLHRIRLRNGYVAQQEVFLKERGERVRDVRVAPGGDVIVLTDSGNVLRLEPR